MWFRSVVIKEGQPSAWSPPEPRHQAELSMDLCVSSLALAASLTSQYWSNWSRGRLPDLG